MGKANTKIIGAFVIGAVALIVVVFIVFGSGDIFKKTNNWVIYFSGSVSGLDVGAPVKVRGVTIGSATSITPYSTPDGSIYVQVIIETDPNVIKRIAQDEEEFVPREAIAGLIKDGLRAQLVLQSYVLGKQYIKLDFIPDSKVVLFGFHEEYAEIPSLLTTGEEMSVAIKRALAGYEKLPIQEILTSLNSTLSGMDSLFRSQNVTEILAAVNKSLVTSQKFMMTLDTTTVQLSAGVLETSEAMELSLNKAETLLEQLSVAAEWERQEFHQTMKELNLAARAIRNLAESLETKPESVIFGK